MYDIVRGEIAPRRAQGLVSTVRVDGVNNRTRSVATAHPAAAVVM